ncbi:MAG: protein-disulfide reductase DsbD [Betaproteobacteria bacterium]|nr:protein-disulfide reductase DsbD [Betaproteobacteria bacterium]
MIAFLIRLLAVVAALAPLPAAAASLTQELSGPGSGPELLEPEQAFKMSARALDPDTVELDFAIAKGYYMYRDRFAFAAQGTQVKLGSPQLPPAQHHRDPYFGEVYTYRDHVAIRLPLQSRPAAAQALDLVVTSQGCADAGVCYTPMQSKASIHLAALAGGGASGGGETALTQGPRLIPATPRFSTQASDLDVAALLRSGGFWVVVASFLGFGLLLAFTPCVLPMIPILSGIIVGEGRRLNKLRALVLSAAYVLGMAITYAGAGVAAAYSGSLIAAALQSPWVLGAFALVFVWLALSMFGLYELQLPSFLHHRLSAAHQRLEGGRIASVALMGALSAVIVSPCVAAPLAGALLYISQTRDVMLGGTALFVMALGMGVPLIAVGVSEGALLPKSGAWMNSVKKFFGVVLLAVAIWIVSPVLPAAATMLLWSALLVGSGVFLRALDLLPLDAHPVARLGKGAGVMALVAGAALLVGALAGSRDPLRPLAGLVGAAAPAADPIRFERVTSPAELAERLRAAGRPVMLDFYADWCVSCKEMENFTFRDPRVRAKLGDMLLLRADVTANTADDKALLSRFSLFGPPGIIFFDGAGREIRGLRVVGYQDAAHFLRTLARASAAGA